MSGWELELLQEFLNSGMRAVKLEGFAEALREVARENNLPIQVHERRNVIYLEREDAVPAQNN